jgi:hypothetical protein
VRGLFDDEESPIPRHVAPRRAIDAPVNPVGRAHPETAQATGRKMCLTMGTKRRRAYEAIRDAGAHGMTADEVEVACGWGHSSASSTVSGLWHDGWLSVKRDDKGDIVKRPTRHANDAQVMVVARVLREEG